MKRIAKSALWTLGALVLLLVAVESLVFILTLRSQRKAEALLREVRGLSVGESSEEDVLSIVRRYGGENGSTASGYCSAIGGETHSVGVSNNFLNRLGVKMPLLRPFGNPFWRVNATFVIQNGLLCFASYDYEGFLGDGDWSVSADVYSRQSFPKYPDAPEAYEILAGTFRHDRSFRTTVTPDATAEQREHAFDLDLSCITRFGECRQPCELMPSVWLDDQRIARERGLSLPSDEINDPRCKKLP